MNKLSKFHTKQLLRLLDQNRRHQCAVTNHDYDFGYKPSNYTTEELEAELATREHIPNKKEAKAIRQARAKKR